jgi:hypothetical protein
MSIIRGGAGGLTQVGFFGQTRKAVGERGTLPSSSPGGRRKRPHPSPHPPPPLRKRGSLPRSGKTYL